MYVFKAAFDILKKEVYFYLVVNLLGIKLELTNMLKLFSPW